MPGQILLAGGSEVDEDGLDEIVLRPPEEEEAESSGDNEAEDAPSLPL